MRGLLIASIVLALIPLPTAAEIEQRNPIITEVMTGTTQSASAEFIEIFNPLNKPFELIGHRVQYKSATGESWLTKIEFDEDVVIEPRGYILLATEELINEGNHEFVEFNSGLSRIAGHVRLVQVEEVEDSSVDSAENEIIEVESALDTLAWGDSADSAETTPATAPDPDESLKRVVDEDGEFVDSDDNSIDFFVSEYPHPQHTLPPQSAESNEPEGGEVAGNKPNDSQEEQPRVEYLSLQISELFVDPELPQTDADDEFVEIFNPNNKPVALKGYTIQTGSSLQYSFTFKSGSIAAKSYKAYRASTTKLTLANSGGRAQILNPNNEVAAKITSYSNAKPGQSWARFDDGFEWTSVVTPGSENVRPSIKPEVTQAVAAATNNSGAKRVYPKIIITEALPDPKKPDLDKTHEFVELYNPNSIPVSLDGYKLKTGKTLSSNQTLEPMIIQPKQYIALFSADNRMTLGNSGGQIQLQDPNGTVVSSADEYGDAPEGAAWASINGQWQWTSNPTPAAKNVAGSVSTGASGSGGTASELANKNLQPEVLSSLSQTAAIPVRPTDYKLIGGAVVFALLYGLYEFRHDARLRFDQLKKYISDRKTT